MCQEFQVKEDRVKGTKFFPFRVLVSLVKPLNCLFQLETPYGVIHMGLFKYERIPNFCFLCGMIGHRYRNYKSATSTEVDVKVMPFLPWLGGVDNVLVD